LKPLALSFTTALDLIHHAELLGMPLTVSLRSGRCQVCGCLQSHQLWDHLGWWPWRDLDDPSPILILKCRVHKSWCSVFPWCFYLSYSYSYGPSHSVQAAKAFSSSCQGPPHPQNHSRLGFLSVFNLIDFTISLYRNCSVTAICRIMSILVGLRVHGSQVHVQF
jgi:hypothetical protein